MVGGIVSFLIASTEAINSIAPEAPEMSGHRLGRTDCHRIAASPKTFLIALDSSLSFSGVDVPWALI